MNESRKALTDMVRAAIRSAHRGYNRKAPRWWFVAELFACGSTRAHQLCADFGFDADEVVGNDLLCEEGCSCQCHED